MRDTLSFSVPGSGKIHELKLGITLIRFIGFDLSFFREQCDSLYEKELKKEKDFLAESEVAREYIRNCHPYCGALLKTVFKKIALDCVIEGIGLKAGVGQDELWVSYMADQTPFGKELFNRMTEYKMGAAINQWTNLRRMQEYAAMKLSVIYGGDETDFSVHKARKLYFDTAFKMTASKLGFGYDDLPAVRVASVPSLRMSDAMMGSTMKLLEPVVRDMAREAPACKPLKGNACLHDRAAGEVSDVMYGFTRSAAEELRQLSRFYGTLPDKVYEPDGLKAIIDLEFDCLPDVGSYIRVCRDGCVLEKYGSQADGIFIKTAAAETGAALEIPDEAAADVSDLEEPDGSEEAAEETVDAESDDAESDDAESDDAESDDAESDDAESDDAESDDAESDDAESDDAESDDAKSDDAESDDAESDDAESDDAESDDAESDDAESDNVESDNVESDNAELDNVELDDVEMDDTDSDETDTDETDTDETDTDETDTDETDTDAAAIKVVETETTATDNPEIDDIDSYFLDSDETDPGKLTIMTARVKEIIRLTDQIVNKPAKIATPQEYHMRCLQLWTDMKTDSNSNVTPDEAFEWLRYSIQVRYEIERGLLPADKLGRFLKATCLVFKLTSKQK